MKNSARQNFAILSSGEVIRKMVDPQGLTVSYNVSRLVLNRSGNVVRWVLHLDSRNEREFRISISGFGSGSEIRIDRISAGIGKDVSDFLFLPVSNLFEALDSIGGIPGFSESEKALFPLKITSEFRDGFSLNGLYSLIYECLVSETDLYEVRKEVRRSLRTMDISFFYDGSEVCHLVVKSLCRINNCSITASLLMDLHGVQTRTVKLSYSAGMGRYVRSDCHYERDGIRRPSFVVAFDLASRLSSIYSDDRSEAKAIELPCYDNGLSVESEESSSVIRMTVK